MRKSEPDSKYFVKSLGFFKYSLSKSTKYTPKLYNLFTVWFPKELVGHNFHALRSQNCSVFTSLPFQRYWELEGAIQTQHGYGQGCPLSHKRPPRVAHSRRTCGAKVHRLLHGNVIISY